MSFEYLQMIVTPYVAKSTGIKFGKICLSHPSRCRGVRGQAYLEIYSKSTPFFPSEMSSFMNSPSVGRSGNETIVLSMRVIRRLQYIPNTQTFIGSSFMDQVELTLRLCRLLLMIQKCAVGVAIHLKALKSKIRLSTISCSKTNNQSTLLFPSLGHHKILLHSFSQDFFSLQK